MCEIFKLFVKTFPNPVLRDYIKIQGGKNRARRKTAEGRGGAHHPRRPGEDNPLLNKKAPVVPTLRL